MSQHQHRDSITLRRSLLNSALIQAGAVSMWPQPRPWCLPWILLGKPQRGPVPMHPYFEPPQPAPLEISPTHVVIPQED